MTEPFLFTYRQCFPELQYSMAVALSIWHHHQWWWWVWHYHITSAELVTEVCEKSATYSRLCIKVFGSILGWLVCLFHAELFISSFKGRKKKEFNPHNTKSQTIQNCRTWRFGWRTEMFIELNQCEHLLTERSATMGFQNLRKLSPSAVGLCAAIISTIAEHFSATLSKRNTSVCLMDFWKPTRFIGALAAQ